MKKFVEMRITVQVHTKARRVGVEPDSAGFFHVYVKELPTEGKANDAVIKQLAKHFKAAQSNITIVKGKTAKNKIVDIVW